MKLITSVHDGLGPVCSARDWGHWTAMFYTCSLRSQSSNSI